MDEIQPPMMLIDGELVEMTISDHPLNPLYVSSTDFNNRERWERIICLLLELLKLQPPPLT